MKRLDDLILAAIVIALAACSGSVIRDRSTYTTEVSWNEAMHRASADELLRLAPTRTATECERLADLGLTLRARAPWHSSMALRLAGVTEDDPGPVPEIPSNTSICGGAR